MPPLGILYLASWLRKHGHECSIVDLAGVDDWKKHLVSERNKLYQAQWVGLTATTPQYALAKSIAHEVRQLNPSAQVIVGGIHVTSLNHANELDFLEKDGFDSYVFGEGYNAVTRICTDIQEGSLKSLYAEPILKDVNNLPFAARDLIDIKGYKYKLGDTPATTFYSQYGCPYACQYCLPMSSNVITSEGLRRISEVKVGDLVLTHKGRFKKVLKTFQHDYEGDLITVRTKGGSDEEFQTTTTVEHEYITRHHGYGTMYNNPDGRMMTYFTKTRADQLSINKIGRASKYIIFPRIKEIKDLDEIETDIEYFNIIAKIKYPVNQYLMKVIGYYLAEGSIANNMARGTYKVVFSFGKSQKEEMYAMELVDALNKLNIKCRLANYSGWRVTVDSAKFARFIENNFGRYSYGKKIPLWVKLLPPEKLDVMFVCYINGDGHNCKKRPNAKFIMTIARTVSKQLCLDMRDIALKIGYTCGIVTHTNKPYIMGRKVNVHKTYVSCYTPSERNCIMNDRDYMYLAVKDIKRRPYKGKVYDIEVEDDHTFCTPLHCVSNCESPMSGSWTVRAMTPLRIKEEVLDIYYRFGIPGIMMFDDEMNLSEKRMLGICAEFEDIKRNVTSEFKWRGFVVTAKFNESIANACRASGCYEIASGIESGSPTILRNIRKPATVDINKRFIITAKRAGLRVKAFLIVGLAGESWRTIRETDRFLNGLHQEGYGPDDIDVSILQIYKGSPLYQNPQDIEFETAWEDKAYYKSSPDSYIDLVQVHTKEMSKYDLVCARNYLEFKFKKKGWMEDATGRKDMDRIQYNDKVMETIKYAECRLMDIDANYNQSII